jgi:hypothetical protein
MEQFVPRGTVSAVSGFSLHVSRDAEHGLLYRIDGTNKRVWILQGTRLASSMTPATPSPTERGRRLDSPA